MYIGTNAKGLTKEIKIPMPWGFVAAKTWGLETNSPVLCLHGWLDNANTFDTLIPLLPKEFYYVCIDLPGQGISSHLAPGMFYTLFNYTVTVYNIMQYLGWKTFSLMGHSWGAYVCAQIAANLNESIDKLILIDTVQTMSLKNNKSLSITRDRIEKSVKLDGKEFKLQTFSVSSVLERVLPAIPDITKEGAEILLQREARNGMHTNHTDPRQRVFSQIVLSSNKEVPAQIVTIKAEILHLFCKHGSVFQRVEPLNVRNLYVSSFKSSGFNQVKFIDGNHFVHLCQPEKVAGHIIEMLRRPPRKDLKPIKLIKPKL